MQSSGISIRISDLIFALQKRWKIIVASTLVGLVFGMMLFAMTFVQDAIQTYEITGSFAISTQGANGLYVNGFTNAGNNDFYLSEDMVDAVTYLIRSDRVANDVINQQQMLGVTPEQLRKGMRVTQVGATQIIDMTIMWDNALDGVEIWNAIVNSTSALMPQTLQLGVLAVINEPIAVAMGVGGMGTMMPMLLMALGFLTGVGYAVMELLVHPTLNNVRDIETMFNLESIGVIPRDDEYFRKKTSILVEEDDESSEIAHNYSSTAYILRNRLGTKEKHHCIFVTSATNLEGKTTVAANLAVHLSDMEHRTLLIDFNTRNPCLGSLFMNGVEYAHSLNALYRGDANESEAITTLTGYLDLLPMVLDRDVISMDATVTELIQRLSEQYEYIILDSAPVGKVSDTLSLKQVTNTALFVVGYDISTIPEIQRSLETLDKAGIRVLGCVVNGVQTARNWISTTKEGENKSKKKKKKKKQTAEEANDFLQSDEQQDSSRNDLDEMISQRLSETAEKAAENETAGEKKKKPLRMLFHRTARKGTKPSPDAREGRKPSPQRNVLMDLADEAEEQKQPMVKQQIDLLTSQDEEKEPADEAKEQKQPTVQQQIDLPTSQDEEKEPADEAEEQKQPTVQWQSDLPTSQTEGNDPAENAAENETAGEKKKKLKKKHLHKTAKKEAKSFPDDREDRKSSPQRNALMDPADGAEEQKQPMVQQQSDPLTSQTEGNDSAENAAENETAGKKKKNPLKMLFHSIARKEAKPSPDAREGRKPSPQRNVLMDLADEAEEQKQLTVQQQIDLLTSQAEGKDSAEAEPTEEQDHAASSDSKKSKSKHKKGKEKQKSAEKKHKSSEKGSAKRG